MPATPRHLLGRFTYANVMSTLAMFLVVGGGTAYAADTVFSADIVDGQVKTVDIGLGQVSPARLALGAVTNARLANGAVDSAKVADESLTESDLGRDSVGASEIGISAIGEEEMGRGAVPSHLYLKQSSTATDATTVKELTVTCFNADRVTGGGFVIAGPGGANVPAVAIQRSYAVDSSTWLVRAVATSGTPTWQLTTIANCAF